MAERNSKAPSAEDVRVKLSYNPQTGVFYRNRPRKDGVVGNVHGDGRIEISVYGYRHHAHKLAWLLSTGAWPTGVIDHINGNPADNRIANLRDVSHSVNSQNQRRPQSDNKSTGVLGVTKSRNGKFEARIWKEDKNIHIGTFDTAAKAHAAYLQTKREIHPGCLI